MAPDPSEPTVALRRPAGEPSEERFGAALCHPSLAPSHRWIPYPATGGEERPYFAGYPGAVSLAQGEPLAVHVASRSPARCFVDVYRVAGCADALLTPRLAFVERLGPVMPHRLPPSAAGRRLSSGAADTDGCRWPGVQVLDRIPADWRSGLYVAQFTSADEPTGVATTRAGEDALFIVRNDGAGGRPALLFQLNVATWAAYHMWHNRTLYMGRTAEGRRWDELRCSRVSLQRPGLGLCLPNETILTPAPPKAAYAFAFVDWIEREGIAVDYCSGLDISAGAVGLDDYRAVVSVGHDEYWTAAQQDAMQAFRRSGGHTVFLGGNLAYWQVRDAPDGASIECYKNSAAPVDHDPYADVELLDPLVGQSTPRQPLTGQTWRLREGSTIPTTGVYNTVRRPQAPDEILVGGGMWWWEELGGPPRPAAGFTVCAPDHWAFAGLDLAEGSTFGAATKLVGHEADGLEVAFDDGRPRLTFADGALPGTELLALADCRAWSEWDFAGWPPSIVPGQGESPAALGAFVTMVAVQEPGHGMLFCAPTTEWVFGLLESMDWTATRALDSPLLGVDPIVEQITRNVLRACATR